MSAFKLLIDTNIFIGLEDPKEVDPALAELYRKCSEHGIRLFIHEDAAADISRDSNQLRREISLSKIRKFEKLSGIKLPERAALESEFGHLSRVNDEVDVSLLYALKVGAVDFLVTQDQGIHARVKASSLARQVLTIDEAVSWVRQTFDPTTVSLPFIEEQRAYEIDLADDIFESLRDGYPEFDEWWRDKCVKEHRLCWTINISGRIAGLVVRKDESHEEAKTKSGGDKILKICTFKVKPTFWGEKLGELLLKQILWYAQRNGYDLVYLTTFPSQTFLIQVLEYYGFRKTLRRENGELFFEKPIVREKLFAVAEESILETNKKNYPRFVASGPSKAFCVPIQGRWHQKLFPELATQTGLPLFPELRNVINPNNNRMPGNTIRKVYLCRAQTTALKGGDVLLFYQSRTPSFSTSQSLTSVGVIESVSSTLNFDDLVKLTAKRSVFSELELKAMIEESDRPIKVIEFLLIGHLESPIPLNALLAKGIFVGSPPQSISLLPSQRFELVKPYMNFGFSV